MASLRDWLALVSPHWAAILAPEPMLDFDPSEWLPLLDGTAWDPYLIPGIDCGLGERIGAEDFDYGDPRCACGQPIAFRELGGWSCPQCDR